MHDAELRELYSPWSFSSLKRHPCRLTGDALVQQVSPDGPSLHGLMIFRTLCLRFFHPRAARTDLIISLKTGAGLLC